MRVTFNAGKKRKNTGRRSGKMQNPKTPFPVKQTASSI